MMKPIAVRAALIAVTALILSACGSTTQDSSDSPESADQTRLGGNGELAFANSHPLPNCAGQDPSSCTYVGFDPAVDGFSFENWGSEPGNLGASDLIRALWRHYYSGCQGIIYVVDSLDRERMVRMRAAKLSFFDLPLFCRGPRC